MVTILQDIADVVKSMSELKKGSTEFRITRNSVARMASEAILQFPVICSKGITIETMSIINKALERQFSSFILIVTSLYNTIDGSRDPNPADYLKNIHQNKTDKLVNIAGDFINTVYESTIELTVEDVKSTDWNNIQESIRDMISPLASVMTKSIIVENLSVKYDREVMFNEEFDNLDIDVKRYTLKTLPKKYLTSFSSCLKELQEEYNVIDFNEELFLVNKVNDSVYGLKLFSEDNVFKIIKTSSISEEKIFNPLNENSLIDSNKRLLAEYNCSFNLDTLNDKSFNISSHKVSHVLMSEKTSKFQPSYDSNTQDLEVSHTVSTVQQPVYIKGRQTGVQDVEQVTTRYDIKNKRLDSPSRPPEEFDGEYGYLKHMSATSSKLMDNDIKKANELVPTMLSIQQIYVDPNGNKIPISYNIGVKAVLHAVTPEDMIKNLTNGVTRNRKFFNFFRWTTGEIAFFKDLVFTVSEIREDVIARARGSSNWWTALRRRRLNANFKKYTFLNTKEILPNATIVCSMEEIDFMKKEYSIDLFKDTRTTLKIMERYFLLGFCIIDEAAEIAYILFDGETMYQTYSFNSLERENSNKAKETRDIMRALSKM